MNIYNILFSLSLKCDKNIDLFHDIIIFFDVPEVEADIFSGIPRVTGIPRDGKQNRYELRDWDGTGKNVFGSGRDRE